MIADSTERRPNLGDLMVLVAAVAVGIAVFRYTNRPPSPGRVVRSAATFQSIRAVLSYATPILISSTVACAAIRLRGPRPSLGRLADLPGAMAVGSAFMVVAFGYSCMAVQLALGTHPSFVLDPARVNQTFHPGLAVAGAWLPLVIGRRWRLDRSWIEVVGIGLGFGWIVLLLVWSISWVFLR